jgi:hypothetical protein
MSCAAFGGPKEFSDRRPAPPVSQQTLDFSVDVPIEAPTLSDKFVEPVRIGGCREPSSGVDEPHSR